MPPKSVRKSSSKLTSTKKSSGVKRKTPLITLAQKKKILATAALLAGAGAAAYKVRSARKKAKETNTPFTWSSMFSFRKKKVTPQVAPGTNPDNFLG